MRRNKFRQRARVEIVVGLNIQIYLHRRVTVGLVQPS